MKSVKSLSPKKRPTPSVVGIVLTPGLGETIPVRAAKAHLSALLDWVATGHEVVVTSGGVAKARLAPIESTERRKVFLGTEEHLQRMPEWDGGLTADEIIRADRDGRGW